MRIPVHALCGSALNAFGQEVAGRVAQILLPESDPNRMLTTAEVAAILAWALGGTANVGEMPLLGVDLTINSATRRLSPDEVKSHETFGETFATYLTRGLERVTSDDYSRDAEAITLVRGKGSVGASVVCTEGGKRLAYHYGGLTSGDEVVTVDRYPIGALTILAASVPTFARFTEVDFHEAQLKPGGQPVALQ